MQMNVTIFTKNTKKNFFFIKSESKFRVKPSSRGSCTYRIGDAKRKVYKQSRNSSYVLLTFITDCRCVYMFAINTQFELTENSFLKTNGIYNNNFPTLKILEKHCNFSRNEK